MNKQWESGKEKLPFNRKKHKALVEMGRGSYLGGRRETGQRHACPSK